MIFVEDKQRFAGHIFHHEIRQPVGFIGAVHRDDVIVFDGVIIELNDSPRMLRAWILTVIEPRPAGSAPPFQPMNNPDPIVASGAVAMLALGLSLSLARAAPVISEIMYRPGPGYPENTALEYIEIHNPDTVAADIGGWALRSGVNYTMPEGTVIPAGEWVVVAANPAALVSAHGNVSALGPWPAGEGLSNNGERIRLSRPGVPAGTWATVDEVTYASEGDWASRTRGGLGWDWSTPANGGGKSLELRNAALSNDNGQNWSPSTASKGGTPGAANTAATANVPPIIKAVKHSPAVPRSTQNVTVSCEVNDEAPAADRTATLFYRNATSTSPPSFSSVAMINDGTGKLTAVLAPAGDKSIWEFYISSSDGTATRTWPAPASGGQNANCQYQVDNEAPSTTAEMYRLTLTGAENSAFTSVSPGSNQQFNQTLIVVHGTETSIRYRSAMRIRGNGSRGYIFKPMRVSIPNDDALDGVTRFNLNPAASFLQYLGMRCFHASGMSAPDVVPAEVRRNGVESTTSTSGTPDYGLWVRMEDQSAEMVDNHWPLANSGNIYKKGRPDEFWRSTASAPATPDQLLDGWIKQNNSAANDWSDLRNFFQVWQNTAASHFPGAPAGDVDQGSWNSVPFNSDEARTIETVADLQQWARWFAMMTLLQSNETNISNGQDDDYACYFVPGPANERRMQLIPHDLDTVFGKGDSPLGPTARGLYDATEQDSSFRPLLPLMGNSSVAGNPKWCTLYHNAIRELCGGVFSDATFPSFVEQHLGTWTPPNIRSEIKTFMSARCSHLLGRIGAAAIPPAIPTASSSVTQTHGELVISEVLAANATAHPQDGVYPDVIELLNSGTAPVDLSGMSLTDDAALPQKFVFPAGTTLAPSAFLVLYADSNFAGSGLHTGFSLDQNSDAVFLHDSVANGGALLDSITFGPQATDFSVGRTGETLNALNTLTLCTPSIGAANTAAALGSPAALRINEWFTNPDFRLDDDFLEIHNSAALPVAIGGMRLTDDWVNFPSRHVLPVLSFIGPGGFHVFKAMGSSATQKDPSELPFGLDNTFGGAALLGENGALADRVDTVSQFRDRSTGRNPDGGAAIATFSVPSPGLPNEPLPAACQALLDGLRISEFIYKPNGGSDFEFIEMLNTGTTALDLSGVRFTNGVDYTFPAGTALARGAFAVVCRNRTAFLSRFPNAGTLLAPGQFAGALDNNDEGITLSLPNPRDVAILNFRYETGWEPLTFTAGYSLTHVDAVALPARDYNERESWTASAVPNGTPGTAPSGPLHHFTWDHTPSSVQTGVPFPAIISARDQLDRVVTHYSGTVPLSVSSSVYITEVTDEDQDQFELQNTGSTLVNTAGWFVRVGNSSGIDALNAVTWTLPSSFAPGEIVRVSDVNKTGWLNFGGNISWLSGPNRGWIMLFDADGTLRDFMAFGWPQTDLQSLNIIVNGSPVTIGSQWTGNGAPVGTRVPSGISSWQRTGSTDKDSAADWTFTTDASTWGIFNPGLAIPWRGALSPAAVTFSDGYFAGFISIPKTATGVRISATDAQLRTGQSAPFNVTAPAPAPDSDGDRMPDAWETAHGLSNAVNDAGTDADGDGFTNSTEYFAGTDPRSGTSALRISSVGLTPSGQVQLTWPTQPGRLYRVRHSSDLITWTVVPGQYYAPASAGPLTASFPAPSTLSPPAYYHVELLLPP